MMISGFNGVTPKLLEKCAGRIETARFNRLDDYYNGRHGILNRMPQGRTSPNNRVVCGFPKYITDTVCGYVFGNPIEVSGYDELKEFARDTHDSELAKDISVFGRGYELMYLDSAGDPRLALIDPRNAVLVTDDTVEENVLFGCIISEKYDEFGDKGGLRASVYTAAERISFERPANSGVWRETDRARHYFGGVPLVEYWNNEEGMGDYEGVIPLIDAYNTLTSDRINDKERFVDAILVIMGAQLPEDEDEARAIIKDAIIQLPDGTKAEYLTKTLNEAEIDVLADNLAANIHKFSQTPDFTDERFSGNTSGVALRYKLLSLEYLAKVKERFFIEGLLTRARLLANILAVKGRARPDFSAIRFIFNRNLPMNEYETAQTLATLQSARLISRRTAMAQLSYVKDIEAEEARLLAEVYPNPPGWDES